MSWSMERSQRWANAAKHRLTCSFNPRLLIGVPIGMFHCPECGDMVVAGTRHTPPWCEEMDRSYNEWMAWIVRE